MEGADMAEKKHYCDSEALEIAWYDFVIAYRVPQLEPFRLQGLIWSKPVSKEIRSEKKSGAVLFDQYSPELEYIVYNGRTYSRYTSATINKLINACESGSIVPVAELPNKYADFRVEKPQKKSWDYVSVEVSNTCAGISKKFVKVDDPTYDDIWHTSTLAILTKIKNMKLKFTPGRAPVFSLITMAIHREIFTVLNAVKRQDRLLTMARDRLTKTITRIGSQNRAARSSVAVPIL